MDLTDEQLETLVYTVLGEAAGEGYEGMAAVAHVIRNRVESGRYASDPAEAAKQTKQFSTWNTGAGGNNPTARYSKSGASYKRAEKAVTAVFSGRHMDPTGGATHYWAPGGMPGGKDPYWAKSETTQFGRVKIGNHVFLARSAPAKKTTARQNVATQRAEQSLMRNRVIPEVPAPRPYTIGGMVLEPLRAPAPLTVGTTLTSRSVKTVDINPKTGMPYKTTPPAGLIQLRPGKDTRLPSVAGFTVPTPAPAKKSGVIRTVGPEQEPIPHDVVPASLLAAGYGTGSALTNTRTGQSARDNIRSQRDEQLAQRQAAGLAAQQRFSENAALAAQKRAQAEAAAAEARAKAQAAAAQRAAQERARQQAAAAARAAALAAVSRPSITGVGGGGAYTTTSFQEDRFQTTTGSLMPASTNNSRWTTGY